MTRLYHALISHFAYNAWIAILFVVLFLTCQKLRRMKGEHWWHHFSHSVMLVAMLYMYAAMSFRLHWISRDALLVLFILISAGVFCWTLMHYLRRGDLKKFWVLTFVQQLSMAYMCLAPIAWIPWLTYALVAYFAVETLFWSRGAFLQNEACGSTARRVPWPKAEELGMAAMAASMGYMFLAMQLKESQREVEALAARIPPGVAAADESPPVNPSPREQAQLASVGEPAKPIAKDPAPAPDLYRVVPGDSLYRIAARIYGDGKRWPDVAAANPGLDLRRLRPGQFIKVPAQ